ncbi:lysoplasmalogenase family protein [Herbinix luporum]|jgi:hypothetical protein|uniref:Putative membrane protein n=1 Tax=Herbinix luporum TaxID=1679721 RepID=A0A0K8J737_9FIRM|nr:lysoplasmalogenase family protein [Herbinix luporum]CUH93345.1 putative membrane protein [Herbinix luporum]HHT56220.1 hypothetical protein [Herbinix luporum]
MLNNSLSNNIKFTVVLLCFLYVLIRSRKNADRQSIFLILALFFTLISDVFLLLSDYYFYGVLTFILAHLFHSLRITELHYMQISDNTGHKAIKKEFKKIIYQIFISLAIILFLWKMNIMIDGLLVACIFYFLAIISNTALSLKLSIKFKNRRNIRYLAIGMILFLLCDINVALFNLSSYLDLASFYNKIYLISSILMWTFYAPSQVLIALSKDT